MKNTLLYLALALSALCHAQNFDPDTLLKPRKTNPIIFAEVGFGWSGGTPQGFTGTLSLNYQQGHNLYTVRYSEVADLKTYTLSPILPIPVVIEEDIVDEYALLYGRRFIGRGGNESYSFSIGASYNVRKKLFTEDDTSYYKTTNAFGVPFELNIKWFKKQKSPYRIYEIIPIGKPVSFGNSIGFKFLGNISKTSFVGLAVTFGFDWHKHY